jgi:hypothetical protein
MKSLLKGVVRVLVLIKDHASDAKVSHPSRQPDKIPVYFE